MTTPSSQPPVTSPGLWKTNWPQTRRHYLDWWDRRGLVIGAWGTGLPTEGVNHDPSAAEPASPGDFTARQTHADYIADNTRFKMARRTWPADILPAAWPHTGTLPLAAYLGAEPEYSPSAIWYHACMDDLESHPPLRFDPDHPRVRELETIVARTVERAERHYLVGLPALLPGIDVLAELRGASTLMMDLIENPDAVHERLDEIYDAWTVAYDRLASIVHDDTHGMAFGYFMLWDQGRVGLAQCDSAAMISPDMFAKFVVPTLRKQCAHLDRCMYHVDGAPALRHLDLLLAIEDLDAIEFTPDPKSPGGGDEQWYPLYRHILDAGKSVWVANLRQHEVIPLLDAIGGQGVFASVNGLSAADAEALARAVEPYRR